MGKCKKRKGDLLQRGAVLNILPFRYHTRFAVNTHTKTANIMSRQNNR